MAIYRPMAGSTIDEAAREMVALANEFGETVEAKFNDLPVRAEPGSDPLAIAGAYRAECERRHQAYLASDACKEARRRAEEAQRERKRALAEALVGAPATITLRAPAVWQAAVDANPDAYGTAAIRYAEKWARIMEGRIARGLTVAKCAEDAAHVADDEGITGHMQGWAGALLARAWVHGEALSQWHDEDVKRRRTSNAAPSRTEG